MELSMSMKQTQTLSPQMMQSMEILQMGSQELLEYIQDQVQENPVLEMEEKYGKGDDTAVLQRKLEWLESTDAQNRYYHQQDTEDDEKDPISNYGTVDEREENLYLYVLSQLEVMDLEPELLPVGRFLVESLNQNGWLDESVEDLAEELGKPVEEVEKALAAVQSLEPAGVGARNLSECLVLQLQHQALRQIPGPHARGLQGLHRRQGLLYLLHRLAQLLRQILHALVQPAVLVQALHQKAPHREQLRFQIHHLQLGQHIEIQVLLPLVYGAVIGDRVLLVVLGVLLVIVAVLRVGGLQPLQLPLQHRRVVPLAVFLLHLQYRVLLDLILDVLQQLLRTHLEDFHGLHHLGRKSLCLLHRHAQFHVASSIPQVSFDCFLSF